jgi:hypothetical protein
MTPSTSRRAEMRRFAGGISTSSRGGRQLPRRRRVAQRPAAVDDAAAAVLVGLPGDRSLLVHPGLRVVADTDPLGSDPTALDSCRRLQGRPPHLVGGRAPRYGGARTFAWHLAADALQVVWGSRAVAHRRHLVDRRRDVGQRHRRDGSNARCQQTPRGHGPLHRRDRGIASFRHIPSQRDAQCAAPFDHPPRISRPPGKQDRRAPPFRIRTQLAHAPRRSQAYCLCDRSHDRGLPLQRHRCGHRATFRRRPRHRSAHSGVPSPNRSRRPDSNRRPLHYEGQTEEERSPAANPRRLLLLIRSATRHPPSGWSRARRGVCTALG